MYRKKYNIQVYNSILCHHRFFDVLGIAGGHLAYNPSLVFVFLCKEVETINLTCTTCAENTHYRHVCVVTITGTHLKTFIRVGTVVSEWMWIRVAINTIIRKNF